MTVEGNKPSSGVVKAVCISPERGTPKRNVGKALLIENHGLENDAHAGNWHRQVSLLSFEKSEEFKGTGAPVYPGVFGENLLVSGMDLSSLPVGTLLSCGQSLLEVTQIGKECHSGCAIREIAGDCIMPREGIFAKVLEGGRIQTGDVIRVVEESTDR